MHNKPYHIILLNYPDGEWVTDYYSTIIPMVNDTIVDESEFKVIERSFSIRNDKVILLVEKIIDEHSTSEK